MVSLADFGERPIAKARHGGGKYGPDHALETCRHGARSARVKNLATMILLSGISRVVVGLIMVMIAKEDMEEQGCGLERERGRA